MDVWEIWIYDENGHGPDGGDELVLTADDGARTDEVIEVIWNEQGVIRYEP